MTRIEELELTVQMLIDSTERTVTFQGEATACEVLEARRETAESILTGQPCNCAEYPFPHKRSRACFRRY